MASDRNLRNYQDLPTIKILLSTILHFSTILMLFIYLLVLTSYQTQVSACINLKNPTGTMEEDGGNTVSN